MQSGNFSLENIRAATNDFSSANKIGEGGFGPVYKVFIQLPNNFTLFKWNFLFMPGTLGFW